MVPSSPLEILLVFDIPLTVVLACMFLSSISATYVNVIIECVSIGVLIGCWAYCFDDAAPLLIYATLSLAGIVVGIVLAYIPLPVVATASLLSIMLVKYYDHKLTPFCLLMFASAFGIYTSIRLCTLMIQ